MGRWDRRETSSSSSCSTYSIALRMILFGFILLPTFLRKRFKRIRLGFFLSFPILRDLQDRPPVREQRLRALLNADLIALGAYS